MPSPHDDCSKVQVWEQASKSNPNCTAEAHSGNQEHRTALQHDAAALADLDISHAQGAGVMTNCTNPHSLLNTVMLLLQG